LGTFSAAKGGTNDGNDAEAICEAGDQIHDAAGGASRPKNSYQQGCLPKILTAQTLSISQEQTNAPRPHDTLRTEEGIPYHR
jgi:hypothetical protein